MQTFLPYNDMKLSIQSLDPKRLGKQRLEAQQILNALSRTTGGWISHPATKMWRGYRAALILYRNLCIEEWIHRGFTNTMEILPIEDDILYPSWFGDDRIHASHRSNLLRKDPKYYGQFGWKEPNDMPYFWPVS